MVQWLHSVIPYVDLECEVLGDVSGVTWSVNGTLIDTCEYYTHMIFIGGVETHLPNERSPAQCSFYRLVL